MIIRTEDKKSIKVDPNDIYYVDKDVRRLCYHLRDGIISGLCIRDKSFAASLSDLMTGRPQFILIFKSLLVNLDKVVEINPEYLLLDNEEIIYLPKWRYREILKAWEEYSK